MGDETPLTSSINSIQNVMTYGSPSAKAEIFVKLIYLENPELLQKVYNQFSDKELNRILGFA